MNQESNPAVKLSSAVISHVVNEIEVECLPSALPEFIEVDLAKIEAGQSVHAKDIMLPAGVALVAHVEAENPVVAAATIPAGAIAEGDAAAAAGKAKRRLLKDRSGSSQAILSIRFNETVDVTRRGSPRRVFFRLFSARRALRRGLDGPTQS